MSAFIVDKKHIDLMVAAIVEGTRDGLLKPLSQRVSATCIGRTLTRENYASVNYRYSEETEAESYVFEHPHYLPTAGELRSAVSCYTYQSCEHPTFEDSTAYKWCRYIWDAIGERKAGDESGPWGFDAATIAVLAAAQHEDGLRLAVTASRDSSAVGPLSDWCMERGLLREPLAAGTRINVKEPKENANARRAAERVQHAEENPHLLKRTDKPTYSPGKLAAANIRKELKAAFPAIKFSVTSDYNSVRIGWECGPSCKAVDTLTSKYKRGNFDGSDDSYKSDHDNTFADVFGNPEYVFTAREYPETQIESVWRTLAEGYGVPYTGPNTNLSPNSGALWVTDMAHRILGKYTLGTTLNGVRRVEGITCGSHEDFWEAY